MTIHFHETVTSIVRAAPSFRVPTKISQRLISMSVLDLARNILASYALANQDITHLFFVDADMGFGSSLLEKMLDFDKPVVSAIYPAKQLKAERVKEMAVSAQSAERLFSMANDFVAPTVITSEGSNGPILQVSDEGFTRVHSTGAGVLLIKREVLERMKEIPGLWAPGFQGGPGWANGLLQAFRPIESKHGAFYGEDYSFCHRWIVECGGEIWANVTEDITHVGQFAFTGRFADKLRPS
ncbi:hypothetical protein BHAOGJBA_1687 [Methylobacterium hispanicum]|uniref:Uncharacterized protein n=1 Tax=Methylobacterium hispanicum TaxID=270350 RepID=A0AAV4ZI78_9HYPH|nr:hypothetical protein BHAOGJBA_1687 [Methylobacterium hispanicum]